MTEVALLKQIETGFLLASAEGRASYDAGALRVCLSDSPEPHLSLALPQQNAHDWQPSITQMEALFAQRSLPPRLEVLAELYPTLGVGLERSGFVRTDEAPVMALNATDTQQQPPDPACEILAAESRLLQPFLYGQTRAYSGPDEGALAWLPHLQKGLGAGHILAAALVQEGEVVAGATVQRGGEVGELAGVWTKAELRRYGFAQRVCRALVSSFFASGGTLCWLSAEPDAFGLYQKLGFGRVGTQVNYAKAQ